MTKVGVCAIDKSTTLESNKSLLRICDHEITWTLHVEIPQVVQRPLGLFVSIG